jgi:hypothetical protein
VSVAATAIMLAEAADRPAIEADQPALTLVAA